MGNYLPNFRGNTDHGTRETKRRTGWLPVAGICIVLTVLVLIAVTITCSLIPLYLSKKDVTIVDNNGKEISVSTNCSISPTYFLVTTNVSMIFATDLSSAVGETVSNDDSLSTQVRFYFF
ncbi:unnamed protein product, partial [Adineta steineri]